MKLGMIALKQIWIDCLICIVGFIMVVLHVAGRFHGFSVFPYDAIGLCACVVYALIFSWSDKRRIEYEQLNSLPNDE